MSKLADAYTWPGVQRSLSRSCPYVPIRLVLILLSNISKWRQFIIKAETNKIMIFYPRHQGIWDIEIWPSFLARNTDSPNPICYAWSNTCTKDEKVNWRQLLINLLLSDKTMLPFSRETSILIIVSKMYCLELILPSGSSHFSNVTMIDSFFLIQSLFFLLVIVNTTTPLVSYSSIRHELLTCYPFQNVVISLWFCAVRACVRLLLLIRIVFMYYGFVTTTLLFSFPHGTVFP